MVTTTIITGKLAFGQVPLYEEPGHVLVQSGAIVRYLARKHGFIGSTEQETSLIDAAAEGAQDLATQYLVYKYVLPEEKKEEGKEKLLKETLPTQLGYFTALLEKNGKNGFLVGSKVSTQHLLSIDPFPNLIVLYLFVQLSFADLSLFAILKGLSHHLDGGSEVISRYPVIVSFVEGISNRDRIKAYAARNVYNQ